MKNLIRIIVFVLVALNVSDYAAKAENKRALLVDISDYGNSTENPNKWANISGANDVQLLSPLFSEHGYIVTSLVDSQATHANITNALMELAKESKKGDVVYIHFSMHSQPFEDLNGDEEDGWDEALIPVDAEMLFAEGVYEGKNHLLDDELEVYFNRIRSKIGSEGQVYVALDVDGGGNGFSITGKQYSPDKTKEVNNYFKLLTSKTLSPITFIYACLSWQSNREVRDVTTDLWHGSLSYYIAQALKGHQMDSSENWIDSIKSGMSKNRRLRKQTLMVERVK